MNEAYIGTTSFQEFTLGDRANDTFLPLRRWERLAVWRFAGPDMDGMALVVVIGQRILVFDEFDCILLLFLLRVVNSGNDFSALTRVLY